MPQRFALRRSEGQVSVRCDYQSEIINGVRSVTAPTGAGKTVTAGRDRDTDAFCGDRSTRPREVSRERP